MSIIKVRNAVKTFGPITAVAGLDLDVAEGECFGLLGPNGAGKTSLVRMIIAASPLTEGNIWVDGKDISRESFLSELQRRGTLSEKFDAKKDKSLLQKEALDMEATAPPKSSINLDPPDEGKKEDTEDDKPTKEE